MPTDGDTDPLRVSMIIGVGVIGSDEDIKNFAEFMVKDFEQRCYKANERLFGNRLQILPMAEEDYVQGDEEEQASMRSTEARQEGDVVQ